jgi:hypothetical protein
MANGLTEDRRVRGPLHSVPQFLEQWSQLVAVGTPSSDRAVVDRLAHLSHARRAHRAPRLVKGKAGVVPLEPAVSDDRAGLLFQIVDHLLVANLQHEARRQDGAPMCHEGIIGAVEAAEFS